MTPQALSRLLGLPIDTARKALLSFVDLVGAPAFKVTYCVHKLKLGYFLCYAEEMMEADGDEVLLFAVEKRSADVDISLYYEEIKAAQAALDQSHREGKLLTCRQFGISPLEIQVREAQLSKKRILVSLWKPPTTTTQPAIDTPLPKPTPNLTELEEEEDSAAPLRVPEPEAQEPVGCDLVDISCLDDIMCSAPQKREREDYRDFGAVMRCVETVDLTKGISVFKKNERPGKKAKAARQMTLQACLKPIK